MILTQGDKMLRTPTYHAFEMYVPFQDATFVPVELGDVPAYGLGDVSVPHVSASSALTREGDLVLALVNLHAREAIDVGVRVSGFEADSGVGRLLTGDAIDAHNTFDAPDAVAPGELAVAPGEGGFTERLNVGRNA